MVLCAPFAQVSAETIIPATRSDWFYFYKYWPTTQVCHSSDIAMALEVIDAHETHGCDDVFSNWVTEWPNGENVTSWNYACAPEQTNAYSKQHWEDRTLQYQDYYYDQFCRVNASGSYSNRVISRKFFYLCPDGYDFYTPPGANYPSCRIKSNATIPEKNLGNQCPAGGGPNIGNPINASTGNKFHAETDYQAPTAFPLVFARTYNSQASGSGKLGRGWNHVYDRSVVVEPLNPLHQSVRLSRPDGRVFVFENTSGTWRSDSEVIGRLNVVRTASGSIDNVEFIDEHDTREVYDSGGRLISITARSEKSLQLTYVNGQLSTVSDDFGHALTFFHDASGRVSRVLDPVMGEFIYNYNAAGELASVRYPDMSSREYLYNEPAHTGGADLPGALTGILDETGSRYATYTYDTQRRAVSSEHADAADKVSITYNADGTSTVEDALGAQRTYTFTLKNGVSKIAAVSGRSCSTCGEAAHYTYASDGAVASSTDFRGIQTYYSLDTTRHLISQKIENNTGAPRITNYAWHPNWRLPSRITESDRVTIFTYDANGNLESKVVQNAAGTLSRVWQTTVNSFGQPLTVDGPRNDATDTTTYTYHECTTGYQCGQFESITNAAGHTITYPSYNGHGQPLTVVDANGLVTSFAYDARQRLTTRAVGAETTTFEYWPHGLLRRVILPDGSYLQYGYDAANRLTEISDAVGNRVIYGLDEKGNHAAENLYDPSGALTRTRTRVFNILNRLEQEIGAAGTPNVTTTFAYDAGGNLTNINAPLGRSTIQAFDAFNRIYQVTDPSNGLTKFAWDRFDQITSVTDPRGKVTSYIYNALGDLTQQVSPDTGTTTNTYDSGGNLKTSTDARNKTATYEYDALNRVTSVTYADQVIGYVYDAGTNQKGRLTQLTDNSGSTSWSYDAQGRVLSRQQTMGAVSKSVGYGYDASGRLQTLTLPSGNVITYGYANGKVASLTLNGATTLLSNVLYHPFGPTTGWTWGNNTLAVREYDQDGKLTLADSAGLKTYAYDDAFRITAINDASDPTLTQSYGYDLLDRLTSAGGSSLNQSWTYDANGNRLTQGGSQASTYTVSATSNRVNAITGALTKSYGYDNAGNTTSDGSATYTYNDASRMISATKGGVTSTYALNGLGQRVRKTTGGASTYFVYDEAGHLIGEYDGSGDLIAETVWFGDIPVAVLNPNGSGGVNAFYIHTDHLNTPRKITRPTDNAIVWRWDSDPFGMTPANENPSGLGAFSYNLRFPGQYFDSETELHYNYYRDYDPATGRYIQSDPIGLKGGINTYAYAAGNSLSLIDAFGLDPVPRTTPIFPPNVSPEPGMRPFPRIPPANSPVARPRPGTGLGPVASLCVANPWLCVAALCLIPDGNPRGACSAPSGRPPGLNCDDDEDDVNCEEWLTLLNQNYIRLEYIESRGGHIQAEKMEHDASVETFCIHCPLECPRAMKFGNRRIQ